MSGPKCNQLQPSARCGFAHVFSTTMAHQTFSKFIRPEVPARGLITDRDLDILSVVLRYRFAPAAQIVPLVGGNEDVTHRRLRKLWEWQLINRWAFPGIRTHSEFYYYLDNPAALEVLTAHRGCEFPRQVLDEVRHHGVKDYAGAALRGEHMKLGFLSHSLMISRMHFMLEVGSRTLEEPLKLASWRQGGELTSHKVEVPAIRHTKEGGEHFWQEMDTTERLPVEPDALFSLNFPRGPSSSQLVHFVYEADRGTMTVTDMLRKLRAYYHFIKRQQLHRSAFGVHPIRAVVLETTTEERAVRLMRLVNHPLVGGPDKRVGLFWFTISPLFSRRAPGDQHPSYLNDPAIIYRDVWRLPDLVRRSLIDVDT